MEKQLARLQQLRAECKTEEALNIVRQLLDAHPEDAKVRFEYARLLDAAGQESEAILHYEHAIANGLAGHDLEAATINLGSSYRALGKYEKAVQVWLDGMSKFSENRALQVFLALGLYNLGKHQEAMQLLLHNLIEGSTDAWISRYRHAMLIYADKLDEVWP